MVVHVFRFLVKLVIHRVLHHAQKKMIQQNAFAMAVNAIISFQYNAIVIVYIVRNKMMQKNVFCVQHQK